MYPGYPFGAVSLPMWGGLATSHRDAAGKHYCRGACRHQWLNATRGLYWFGHKVPMSWVPLAAPRYRRCDAPGGAPLTPAESAEIAAAARRANATKMARAARAAATAQAAAAQQHAAAGRGT